MNLPNTMRGLRWSPSSRIVWKFENDDGSAFVNFAAEDCALLERAFFYFKGNSEILIKHPSRPWQFDLCEMTQRNTITESNRRIRRVLESAALDVVMDRVMDRNGSNNTGWYVAHVSHVRQQVFLLSYLPGVVVHGLADCPS